jgi:hypothetical protein
MLHKLQMQILEFMKGAKKNDKAPQVSLNLSKNVIEEIR